MRKIVCAMQMSLDSMIEGPDGNTSWIPSWEDHFGLTARIDACVMGAGMYPGYEFYWDAIAKTGCAPQELGGRPATPGEAAFAAFAGRCPHIVLSNTLNTAAWPHTRFVCDIETIARMKDELGKDIYAVGGARFVATLFNHGLVDELVLLVHPIVLGAGKRLFAGFDRRASVELKSSQALSGGLMRLDYEVRC